MAHYMLKKRIMMQMQLEKQNKLASEEASFANTNILNSGLQQASVDICTGQLKTPDGQSETSTGQSKTSAGQSKTSAGQSKTLSGQSHILSGQSPVLSVETNSTGSLSNLPGVLSGSRSGQKHHSTDQSIVASGDLVSDVQNPNSLRSQGTNKTVHRSNTVCVNNPITESYPRPVDQDQASAERPRRNIDVLRIQEVQPRPQLPVETRPRFPQFPVSPALRDVAGSSQDDEKERLISRILSIVRATMNNPSATNSDISDTAMLKHCMNILSNPLNGFGLPSMSYSRLEHHPQPNYGDIAANLHGAAVLGPAAHEANRIKMSQESAHLAMADPNMYKMMHQKAGLDEDKIPDMLSSMAACMAANNDHPYNPSMYTPQAGVKSALQQMHKKYPMDPDWESFGDQSFIDQDRFSDKKFPFGGFQGRKGDDIYMGRERLLTQAHYGLKPAICPIKPPSQLDTYMVQNGGRGVPPQKAEHPYQVQDADLSSVQLSRHGSNPSEAHLKRILIGSSVTKTDSEVGSAHQKPSSGGNHHDQWQKANSVVYGSHHYGNSPLSSHSSGHSTPTSGSFTRGQDRSPNSPDRGQEESLHAHSTRPDGSHHTIPKGRDTPHLTYTSGQSDSLQPIKEDIHIPPNSAVGPSSQPTSGRLFKHIKMGQPEQNNFPLGEPYEHQDKYFSKSARSSLDSETSIGAQHSLVSSSSNTKEGSTGTIRKRRGTDENLSRTGFPMTSSGRNKGLGKGLEPKFECQVCGDVAAGFHCGAYVCEACKKFYLRCLKNDHNLLTCPKSERCEINKENRSHCQYCRYQKCLSLGMYRPGREYDKNLKVDFKAIPCKVCGAASSGFHFGAITCEGCKGFFRRMLKENLHSKFTCSSGDACDITSANRTFCKACRFHKCIKIGMNLQGTRLGRQSNSIKRNTLMAYHMQDFEGPLPKKKPHKEIKQEPVDDDYPRPSEGIKDMDCCILDDVAFEAIENMDFDASILDMADSPRLKESTPGGVRSSTVVTSSPGHQVTHPYMSHKADSSGNAHDGDKTRLSTNEHGRPGGTPQAANHVAKSHNRESSATTTTGCTNHRDTSDYGKPLVTEHGSGTVHKNHKPNGTETAPRAAPEHEDSYEDRATAATHRMAPVGVEIYADPDRLVDYLVEIYKILDGMKEIPESLKQFKIEIGCPQSIWNYTMQGFVHNSYIMLKFLKAIPGFRSLNQSKQIDLCQETIYPISLLYHSQNFRLDNPTIKFFCFEEEAKELFFASFPNFRGMLVHFEHCGHWIAEMKLDRVELALITVIFVLTATDCAVDDSSVASHLEELTLTLFNYSDRKNTSRGGQLLAKMAELKRANCEHHEMARLTIQQNPDISFGQLWQEIFTST